MSQIPPFIGIDFGTTNSKMAWYNPKTKQADFILNAEGKAETPSVVYFGENETLVGDPALEMLEYEQERERVILSVKRELVATPLLAVRKRSIKPTEVVAEILRKLKSDAENLQFHRQVTRVVITYPASFGPLERDKIREAAQLAGFTEIEMLEEPVAAALAYAQMGLQIGRYVLVYDLGGGTFDLAVLNYGDDGVFRLALEPQGIKRCGGDDFDDALYNYCDKIAKEKLGRPISLTGKRDLYFLQQCRKRKENLTRRERISFTDLLRPASVIFEHEIDRGIFESLIRSIVEETVRKTKTLLAQANTDGQEVDTMVLIGGSSRVPLVQRLLEQSLPLKPLQWQYQDVAVALGAAYHAQNTWGGLGAEKTATDQYRRAVEEVWSNRKLDKAKIEQLRALANQLYLDKHQVAEVEREVMGDVKEAIFERQAEPQILVPLPRQSPPPVKQPEKTTRQVLSSRSNLICVYHGHYTEVDAVSWSPDGKYIASAAGAVHIWNAADGKHVFTYNKKPSQLLNAVSWSPDGKRIASGGGRFDSTLKEMLDNTVQVWDATTGGDVFICHGHEDSIQSVAWSPDGKRIASGSHDGTVRVWNATDGRLVFTSRVLSKEERRLPWVHAVAWSPDGKRIASGSHDGTVQVWDAANGGHISTYHGSWRDQVHAVAWSPDGKRIASGGYGEMQIWDAADGEHVYIYEGRSAGLVHALAWSPDGKYIAVGSHDKKVRVWK